VIVKSSSRQRFEDDYNEAAALAEEHGLVGAEPRRRRAPVRCQERAPVVDGAH
jgi:hypothetical protein